MAREQQAIFLDALGTLVRLEEPWPGFVDLLFERHEITVELPAARAALLAEMSYYRRKCVLASDSAALARLRRECAQIVRSELSPALDEVGLEELVRLLLEALQFEPFDDVLPALTRWRAAGKQLIVVSNWDISLHEVLQATGLRPLLDGVISSAEVGRSKPDPTVFAAALTLVGLPAEEVVHIGDSLEEDVGGARAAGIEAVLLARGEGPAQAPDGLCVIASLREW